MHALHWAARQVNQSRGLAELLKELLRLSNRSGNHMCLIYIYKTWYITFWIFRGKVCWVLKRDNITESSLSLSLMDFITNGKVRLHMRFQLLVKFENLKTHKHIALCSCIFNECNCTSKYKCTYKFKTSFLTSSYVGLKFSFSRILFWYLHGTTPILRSSAPPTTGGPGV